MHIEFSPDLVLEQLPNGEFAWLRPESPIIPQGHNCERPKPTCTRSRQEEWVYVDVSPLTFEDLVR